MEENKPNILLVEDDPDYRDSFRKQFGNVYRIIYAVNTKMALSTIRNPNQKYDLILLDLILEAGMSIYDGLDLIEPMKNASPQTPIIVITSDNSSQTVQIARELGADHFIRKDELEAISGKKLFDKFIIKKRRESVVKEQNQDENSSESVEFIGESEVVQELKLYLKGISDEPDTFILITGESGVGKEVAARFVHQVGTRKNKTFKAINLSTLSESLMESRLFGHKKGAFTDAKTDTIGLFEQADGGILFLDEIGEISHDIQVQLLRFLETKVINPIGGEEKALDVQIIAATNRNLEEEVTKGNFRADLYYRMTEFPIYIPPLRERKEDLPLLIDFFLKKERVDKALFSSESLQKLLDYDYPGNIRELQNILRSTHKKFKVLKKMKGLEKIEFKLLPNTVLDAFKKVEEKKPSPISMINTNNFDNDVEKTKAITELTLFEKALKESGGRKVKAAQMVKLSADTFRNRIKSYHDKFPELFNDFPQIRKRYLS